MKNPHAMPPSSARGPAPKSMIKPQLIAAALALAAGNAWAQAPGGGNVDAQLIKQGEYLSRAADCIACHTATNGKPYAGGLPLQSPIGTIYSTNITPDKETGIGNYSFEDFDRAVRQGIGKNGSLYPAMPYTSYANITPDDMKALYAYFMHGVQPVRQENKDTDIPWPLSMRWPLGIWRFLFAPEVATGEAPPSGQKGGRGAGQQVGQQIGQQADQPTGQQSAAGSDAEILRGRYLVEGVGHCSACHTPRGFALQEKASTNADGHEFLSGAVVEGWLAKDLRGDVNSGLGSWSKEDIVAFLKSGRNAHSAAFGGMAQVVQDSTQYLTDADLNAIAAYLKTLTPAGKGSAAKLTYSDVTGQALRTGNDKSDGAITFLNNCAACHRSTGKGYTETFPQLAQSSTVLSPDPASLIHIVLKGAQMPATQSAPTAFAMPGFGYRLTDREVADVVTFVRNSWGNQAPAVTADQVAKIRKDIGAVPAPVR